MDIITMSSVVRHGLIQRDRIFSISVLLPDKPGELCKVADTIAKQQGNVITGSKAETDLQTQISTISGNKKTGGRITGTFYSKRKSENGKKSDK